MVATALTPAAEPPRMADAHWVAQTADRVLAAMEETRSTWQMWHVRAEAQRHVRTVDLPAEQATTLVDLLVDEVLDRRSVALAAPPDGIEEPGALRRVDGSSVYTVAGADLYTSQRILDAEQRLLTAAGRRDGTVVDESAVDLALLEMAANGTALDVGQASLVQQMCTSGARLQLAIAPAGAGKTTAMRALTLAWTDDGGQVIGLAPSAAAAAVLAEQTGIRTDTLAKLTWSPSKRRTPGLGACGRPVDIDHHRRSRHGRHPVPRHRRSVRHRSMVQVSGWSVMINNSPRSAPAASSATSNRATAPSTSPSCTASPTPVKRPHRSRSEKAIATHSTSTLITAVFMSAT